MAVLKSFELNGKKESFANWISNLSPCETPFISMIGKEGITQAQYSWQTDRLAPAVYTGFEEGSNAEFTKRNTTKEIHNYTSTLRKVVHITDTTDKIELYGRDSEATYQMKKAGCEMKRDLEYMVLHNVVGNPGLPQYASRFAGFEGLVGGKDMHDEDTGAVVHKTIQVSSGLFTRFGSDEIFDLTYNLYLAGSKANKIMFHPKHAPSFAAMLTNNPETPHVHRMFDGLDDAYNAQVKRIKDPLGRYYDLVPNRYMPVDKIYFFNEEDWTQMILRSPSVQTLGRNGSSTRYLMEMEVGLRHRHPFASGILAIHDASISNDLIIDRTDFTAAVNDVLPVTSNVLVDGTSEPGTVVHWHSSHPEIVSFQNPTTEVAGAMGEANNFLQAHTRQGNATVWTISKGVKSAEFLISVRAPTTELIVSDKNPTVGSTVQLTASVKKVDGTAAGADIRVDWYKSPESGLTFSESFTNTDANGVATVDAEILAPETALIQCSTSRYNSNHIYLNYVPVVASLDLDITPDTFLVGDNTQVIAQAVDHEGAPIEGAVITFINNNPDLATLSTDTLETDDQGIAEINITGVERGVGSLRATSGNVVVSGDALYYVGTGATMTFDANPDPVTVGEVLTVSVALVGHDGSPIRGVPVEFSSTPTIGGLRGGTTDNNGEWSDTAIPLVPGPFQITASCPRLGISKSITVETTDNGHNIPYTHQVSGHTGLHTHSTEVSKEVVMKTFLYGMPEVGKRIECFSLTPEIAEAVVRDVPSNSSGENHIDVYGKSAGIAKFTARVKGNTSNVIHFEVDVRNPSLEIKILPNTQMVAGDVEFSAVLKDANNNYVQGIAVEWIHPELMLSGRVKIPTANTDNLGHTYFKSKVGTPGNHKVYAQLVSNPLVKAQEKTLTGYMP